MTNFLDHRHAQRFHLSEDTLLRMISQELSPARRWLVKRHLHRCPPCRERAQQLQRVALEIAQRRENVVKQFGPLSSARRDLFIRRLDLALESPSAMPWWRQLVRKLRIRPFGNAVPSYTSALVVVCAGLILFSVWRWQLPTVSASEFLDRAVALDSVATRTAGAGVLRQRLRVSTTKKTFEHIVYRDGSGSRQLRNVKAEAQEADLATRLALAGVNWDDPLSPVSFKNWHDRQSRLTDDVQSSGDGLLTITTRLSSTSIVQESLTVREDGFHPIERIVQYREFGTVAISEISFDLLSSETANQLFFEPTPSASVAASRVPAPALLPSKAQLDETELQARFLLNQQNADTGEQIEITRDVKGVRIQGLVESEERKRELKKALHDIPFLSVTIQSLDELKSTSSSGATVTASQQQSTVAQVSPLEQSLVQHGRSRDDLSRISAGLFNDSLAINRSSRALEQILHRFSSDEGLSFTAIDARNALLARNTARLLDDLKEQEHLLNEAQVTAEKSVPDHSNDNEMSLTRLAERNAALTRELVSGAGESGRSAESIAAELVETISQLRDVALQLHHQPQNSK